MAVKLVWNKKFKNKLEKYISKHPEMREKIQNKLKLFINNPYAPELKNHKLSGKLNDLRAIIIDYDCRILFHELNKNEILLVDVGKHDEVY